MPKREEEYTNDFALRKMNESDKSNSNKVVHKQTE